MLEKIVTCPYLNLVCGVVLLVTAGCETWESLGEHRIGAHHGILVFSIVHILKSLPEIMHGLKEVDEAKETLE